MSPILSNPRLSDVMSSFVWTPAVYVGSYANHLLLCCFFVIAKPQYIQGFKHELWCNATLISNAWCTIGAIYTWLGVNRQASCQARVSFVSKIYRIVVSTSLSRFEAHVGLFRLLMKGIFDAYLLWPFGENFYLHIINTG